MAKREATVIASNVTAEELKDFVSFCARNSFLWRSDAVRLGVFRLMAEDTKFAHYREKADQIENERQERISAIRCA